jgi:hypothetical protein
MAAGVALVEASAERSRSTLLDGSHHSALLAAGRVLSQESFAVPPDDVGDFKPWP